MKKYNSNMNFVISNILAPLLLERNLLLHSNTKKCILKILHNHQHVKLIQSFQVTILYIWIFQFQSGKFVKNSLFKMSGGEHVDESQFKGLSKYFNGVTNRGRANVAKATYATVGLIILYFMVKPKSKK